MESSHNASSGHDLVVEPPLPDPAARPLMAGGCCDARYQSASGSGNPAKASVGSGAGGVIWRRSARA